MTILLWLAVIAGVMPLTVALALLRPAISPRSSVAMVASSSMLCALAFNLTFFWQELWLVLSKAMTPGLHPVLYHNDHDWTGRSPYVELLQGVGAIATFVCGATFLLLLTRLRVVSGTMRLFVAWIAFEGLFQSLSQVAIGALLPGNDVGRAFSFLGFSGGARELVLGCAVAGMAIAGYMLARHWPSAAIMRGARPDRGLVGAISIPAAVSVVLLIPFRLPRDLIEVVLVPAVVNVLGVGWTSLGAVLTRDRAQSAPFERPGLAWPASALLLLLAMFQLVLARGIAL